MLVAVLQLRNEAYYLRGCLDHLRDHVDAFVALDDGSTDETRAILAAEPKMADVLTNPPRPDEVGWDEPGNRSRLLRRAKELGARWVLCGDADERFEQGFLARLPEYLLKAEKQNRPLVAMRYRELWDGVAQYRADGLWGRKTRCCAFPLPDTMTFGGRRHTKFHGVWYPEQLVGARHLMLDHGLYHLRMVKPEDRIARRDRYVRLDPESRFQRVGYDYLTETRGVKLKPIPPGREYAFHTLPEDLRQQVPAAYLDGRPAPSASGLTGWLRRLFSS
ncbi:glycosyltransferase family 2 protein [Myxococcus sp. CA039A]|uniref:glycosyltransferase family 2 protein n=1 Tax=Myxococcus sp. CA039A TaxID=2741737 RepID=UPI00157A8231|nr:glycosyltransferase family 2 protein [Myxococcus sp. CA039A]NTX50279.1 glycosyltransferase family 2 protein [Myxococcus sp. CA039A]